MRHLFKNLDLFFKIINKKKQLHFKMFQIKICIKLKLEIKKNIELIKFIDFKILYLYIYLIYFYR
jgi:hypothetical protein